MQSAKCKSAAGSALLFSLLVTVGCASTIDIREHLLESARRDDPDFPDGTHVRLTRYAYIGFLETDEGPIHVAMRRAVITGMLCPRGVNTVDFFDRRFRLIRSVPSHSFEPLWFEGGKMFLFGECPAGPFPIAPEHEAEFAADECPSGNVIDFSRGFARAVFRREPRYGSTGGVEDVSPADPRGEYNPPDARRRTLRPGP
jgi:hypothetical protein